MNIKTYPSEKFSYDVKKHKFVIEEVNPEKEGEKRMYPVQEQFNFPTIQSMMVRKEPGQQLATHFHPLSTKTYKDWLHLSCNDPVNKV